MGGTKSLELKSQQSISLIVELQFIQPPPSKDIKDIKDKGAKKKGGPVPPPPKKPESAGLAVADLPPLVVIEEEWEDFIVGQLILTCSNVPVAGKEGAETTVRWVYYIQGILSDKVKSLKPITVPITDVSSAEVIGHGGKPQQQQKKNKKNSKGKYENETSGDGEEHAGENEYEETDYGEEWRKIFITYKQKWWSLDYWA